MREGGFRWSEDLRRLPGRPLSTYSVVARDRSWLTLLPGLVPADLLPGDPAVLERIREAAPPLRLRGGS